MDAGAVAYHGHLPQYQPAPRSLLLQLSGYLSWAIGGAQGRGPGGQSDAVVPKRGFAGRVQGSLRHRPR